MKPNLDFEVLRWADRRELEVWDVRIFGADQHGNHFEREIRFDVPVDVTVVSDHVAMFTEGILRKLQ